MQNTKMNGRERGKREVKRKEGGRKKGKEGEREGKRKKGREEENVMFYNGPDTLHVVFNWIKNIQG